MSGASFRELVAQEAAEWFVRHRSGPCSLEEREQFAVWLKSSPTHVEEYLRTAVALRDLEEMAQVVDTPIEALLAADAASDPVVVAMPMATRAALPHQSSRRRLVGSLALAATVVIAVVGGLWIRRDGQLSSLLPQTYHTAHGEQRSWLLPDGSNLSLDSDSSVSIDFSDRERWVRVDKGRALFRVVHEAQRRFRVSAGDTGVIAIGTQFDVLRSLHATQVTVVEGKVAVFTGDAPQVQARAVLPEDAVALGAGEQIKVVDQAPPPQPQVVNVPQTVAWVQHQIAFDQQPLGEVASQFNRYSDTPIVVEDERIRDIRISGVFDAYDTSSFVQFIARLKGVNVQSFPDRIVVDSSPP